MKREVKARIASCLLAALMAAPAAVAEEPGGDYRLLGPLRARDMTPFGLLVLDMFPSYTADVQKGWAIELDLQTSNNWLPSKSAIRYLETRPEPRAPISQADADNLLALGEDVFFVDGAVQLLAPTFHYVFNERWAAYASVPVLFYNGGLLDSSIESFHEDFGYSSQGREFAPRDSFSAIANIRGQGVSLTEEPSEAGLADPIFGVRRSWAEDGWGIVTEAAVKLPVADEDKLFSTGDVDLGLQLVFQRWTRRHGFHVGFNNVWVGGYQALDEVYRHSLFGMFLAWEWAATRRGSLVAQVYARQSSIDRSSDSDILAPKYQVLLGWRWRRSNRVYSVALTENVETMNNTPDVGWHLSIAWISN